jgi:hypothetical protein
MSAKSEAKKLAKQIKETPREFLFTSWVILLITLLSSVSHAFAAPLAEKDDALNEITARTLYSDLLWVSEEGGHSHSRTLMSSSCDGLSNARCKNDAGCEQAGFVGEKYCTDAPAPPP